MSISIRLGLYTAAALAALAVAFLVSWDAAPHFDFSAFAAAESLAATDGNPYDIDELNGELTTNPDVYGDWWANDDTGNLRMFFFNPPAWFVELRVLGMSALVMSIVGGVVAAVSLAVLSVKRTPSEFGVYTVGFLLFIASGYGTTTMVFGQTGLLVAGLVGVYLVVIGRRAEGVPIALLMPKPHLAFALGLPSLLREPTRTVARIAPPALLLVAASLLLYPAELWMRWIESLISGDATVVYNDLTLRTLIPRFPLPAWSSVPLLLVAIALTCVITLTNRGADPKVLALMSLSTTAFLSGHAFTHDFLWLVFVPPVLAWTARQTMLAIALVLLPSMVDTGALASWVDPRSLVVLVVTVYLMWSCSTSGGETSDGALGGQSTVDGEDRSRGEHRLATR